MYITFADEQGRRARLACPTLRDMSWQGVGTKPDGHTLTHSPSHTHKLTHSHTHNSVRPFSSSALLSSQRLGDT